MDHNKASVEKSIVQNQQLSAMLIAYQDDSFAGFPLDYRSDSERAKVFQTAQLFVRAENPLAIAVLSQVWFVPKLDGSTHLPIRDSDQRREGVAINLFYRAQGRKFTTWSVREIMRDNDGKISGLLPDITIADGVINGEVCRLFPLRPCSRADQKHAQIALPPIAIVRQGGLHF